MADESDIRQLLKASGSERKATKGLNEVARALEQRKAVCAFLADDVNEDNYTIFHQNVFNTINFKVFYGLEICAFYKKLIEALARDANVPLVKVDSAKTLGEWVGLCKYRKS